MTATCGAGNLHGHLCSVSSHGSPLTTPVVLCVPVVRGLEGRSWGGTYAWKKVCALTGATVDLRCFFTYPPKINGQDVSVEKTLWFTKERDRQPEDLRSDPQYAGRLHDLSVQWHTPDEQSLSCVSKCSLGSPTSYIWYENGEEVPNENFKVYTPTSGSKNSYSCAIKGHRQLVSPPMCVSRSCNKVHYHKGSICALKGSSVDLNCTYSSYDELESKFWYRPDHKHLWADPSVPQDLRLEEQYHARVEFPPEFEGHCTLRIQNVTESDSAEYRFKFTARDFEWMNSLPGTNLTVTAATVRVNAVKVEDSHTVARLLCHTGCRPSADLSFCWRRNGDPLARCSPLHAAKPLELILNPGDYVTCDVEGHPLSISPRLYALRAPSVSLSDSGDILEGAPLNLSCISDSSFAEHRWYKQIRPSRRQIMTSGPVLVFRSIKSSDSAEYFCTVDNELGKKMSEPVVIDVKCEFSGTLTYVSVVFSRWGSVQDYTGMSTLHRSF
ncbi:uncharacterized protein LOC127613126 isoform X3 [Hippocampus zosterae]|uniref:uncharacterized protein LOC127613126 isoform X3 n=1 Tax=Hippocampus zosterae TaxID=109293 RepID=UPI00223DB07A|nr:uncharacterized protein LOC127613126 isoform X3 [Hippocampus zosterae]